MDVFKYIEDFGKTQPFGVFSWHDSETEAKGWLVLNSLRGGAAGGGTRMRQGVTYEEVVSLAKVMEIKFSITGPPIGGAKSGIDFDPSDPRKEGVLRRWYQAILPLLRSYYGTGGDLNVSEADEVRPMLASLHHVHPQLGIAQGHYEQLLDAKTSLQQRVARLNQGAGMDLTDQKFACGVATVSDMITGYGVAMSVVHYYTLWGKSIEGQRALIQGWGNVSAAAALYLARHGVRIVGIIDKTGGVIVPEGIPAEEVEKLFLHKDGTLLVHPDKRPYANIAQDFFNTPADIFIPGAASRLIDQTHVDALVQSEVQLISCGANAAFNETQLLYGQTTQYADERLSVIPDFIANCGMARVFSFCMENAQPLTEAHIFQAVSSTIYGALERVRTHTPDGKKIAAQAFRHVFELLQSPEAV